MKLNFQVNGQKQWFPVTNFSREDIVKWMELLRTQDDDGSALRWRKMWHTEFPSIQGPWTPFTFRDSAVNVAEFPNVRFFKNETNSVLTFQRLFTQKYMFVQDKLGVVSQGEKSATEKLLELYEAQKERDAKEAQKISA